MMRILFEININLKEFQIGIHNGMIFLTLQELDNLCKSFQSIYFSSFTTSGGFYYLLLRAKALNVN